MKICIAKSVTFGIILLFGNCYGGVVSSSPSFNSEIGGILLEKGGRATFTATGGQGAVESSLEVPADKGISVTGSGRSREATFNSPFAGTVIFKVTHTLNKNQPDAEDCSKDEPFQFKVFVPEVKVSDGVLNGRWETPEYSSDPLIAGHIIVSAVCRREAAVEVKPLEIYSDVKVRLIQAAKIDRKRYFRPPLETGQQLSTGGWKLDGIEEFTPLIETILSVDSADYPTQSFDSRYFQRLVINDEFKVFIQYKLKNGPWKTLKKGTWEWKGTCKVVYEDGAPFSYDGVPECRIIQDFVDSTEEFSYPAFGGINFLPWETIP